MHSNATPGLDQVRDFRDSFVDALPEIIAAIVVIAIFVMLASALRWGVRTLSDRAKRRRNLGFVLGRLAQALTILVGLLIASTVVFPEFKPGDLIQILGIGSVAIGFAFRDILQNFLAGILILLTEPFRIDDQIVFGEYEGTVEDIHTRATAIRTYDGRRVVIPNGMLFTNVVTVNTAFARRRLEYDIGIGYGDDIVRAKQLILEAIAGVAGVLNDPRPDVLTHELADNSVVLRARWWIEPPRRADVLDFRDRVLTAVKQSFDINGIDMPFPTQVVLFHDQSEETDGDRHMQREGWPAGPGSVPAPRRSPPRAADGGASRDAHLGPNSGREVQDK